MNRLRLLRHGWLLRWVLAALLCLPLLGALHQVVHAPQRAALQSPDASLAVVASAAKSALAPLFAGHGSDADCRVFDQLAHGQALPSVLAWALPALAPVGPHPQRVQTQVGQAPASVRARGPPRLA